MPLGQQAFCLKSLVSVMYWYHLLQRVPKKSSSEGKTNEKYHFQWKRQFSWKMRRHSLYFIILISFGTCFSFSYTALKLWSAAPWHYPLLSAPCISALLLAHFQNQLDCLNTTENYISLFTSFFFWCLVDRVIYKITQNNLLLYLILIKICGEPIPCLAIHKVLVSQNHSETSEHKKLKAQSYK